MNSKFPKFHKMDWNDILNFEKFEDLIAENKIEEYKKNFIKLSDGMLQYNPKKRLTIQKILENSFLQ